MENLTESNRLISEFMGFKVRSVSNAIREDYVEQGGLRHFVHLNEPIEGNPIWDLIDVKYHTSWDWLIPVAQKIHSIPEVGYIFARSLDGFALGFKIDLLYAAVIESIKWYNANKDLQGDGKH